MKIEKCFCGWTGPRDTMIQKGVPICPVCQKQFTNMRCEGCGE